MSPAREIDAGSYRVTVAAGLREGYAARIAAVAPAHHYAIVSDVDVAPYYGEPLVLALAAHAPVSLHVIPSGEAHKTRDTWARVTDGLLDAGCGRDTTVVALGGGVVGDLAGFVAATFMRGVPVVQCPTSLLAMIDASVGGKTGVDTEAGKNLVGAFHPPAAVLADVETLRTLSLPQRRAGLAEAFKHGVLADAQYFADLEASLQPLLDAEPVSTLDAVARSVQIKADVVRDDAREHGRRKVLNFGHTLGHALEHVSGYALLHGEAVAIGMVLEARIAERLGIAEAGTSERIAAVLERAGLPVERPRDLQIDSVVDATRLDKKSRGGQVEYALPTRIGAMAAGDRGWALPVDDQLVHEVLRVSAEHSGPERRRRVGGAVSLLFALMLVGGGGAMTIHARSSAPVSPPAPLLVPPAMVEATLRLDGAMVRGAKRDWVKRLSGPVGYGEPVPVQLTAYCLKGTTRRDNYVRQGIVAADPRVFPLGRYVDVYVGRKYHGRFLVDDTGGVIKDAILDIWTPSCRDARVFGRRRGTAVLVPARAA